jgi:hypothetical protein
MQSETIGKLAEALAKAQAVIESAKKDAENPFFKSTYADLASVWDVARRPLSDNGLSVSQLPGISEGQKVRLQTILMHSSGEWLSSDFDMPYLKADPQAVGSALTYARRYSLAAIVGIVAEEDDDGNSAAGKGKEEKKGNPTPPPPKNDPAKPQGTPTPNAPVYEAKKHDDLDQKQQQQAIAKMLLEQYGELWPTELERMTGFTAKDGTVVPGKSNPYELATKANANGETRTSITYIKVREEYKKWAAAMNSEGELL